MSEGYMISTRTFLNKNIVTSDEPKHYLWVTEPRTTLDYLMTGDLPIRNSIATWNSGETFDLMQENLLLHKKLNAIMKIIAELEQRIPKEKIIILREISRAEAKKEIKKLFATDKILYYSDISEQLQLDLRVVVEICHELEEAGEIVVDDKGS